jgi:predicted metalloprotease with PDZ domain
VPWWPKRVSASHPERPRVRAYVIRAARTKRLGRFVLRRVDRLVTPLALIVAVPVSAQISTPVTYDVSIPAPSARVFHVRADFSTRGKDTLYVSLPAWSPGIYRAQNYARSVRAFGATNATGQPLVWDRLDKDTWRVVTGKSDCVTAEFDFLADSIALSWARISGDFGQFLGTNLFLYEEGQLDRPAEVRFTLPAGWQVTTALAGVGPYAAPNYHELADAMTFVGKYSLDSLQVDDRWIRIAVWPPAAYTAAVQRNMRRTIEKIAKRENALFGGPPYDRYTVFVNVIRELIDFGGVLEHSVSQFDIFSHDAFADEAGTLGGFMVPLMAHGYFHLFNVKRVRPSAMWPYDYHAEQHTPLLWWSEGVTDYYAYITSMRAGLRTPLELLAIAAQRMQQVEWAPDPWNKGALTGMLLDVAIRDATDNRRSLDDVTRALYTRFYHKNMGFTAADLLGLLREVGMPDVDGFYERYINGREPLPYEAVFPKAGITVARQIISSSPFLGVNAQPGDGGTLVVQAVVPGSAAEAAGLEPGDILLKIGDIDTRADEDWRGNFRDRYRGQAGAPLVLGVTRRGQALTLNTQVRERPVVWFGLTLLSSPTEKQARIWRGLSTGSTGN